VEKRYRLLALVRQEGVTRVDKEPEDTVDAWPHLVSLEFIAAAFITLLIIFFAIFYNAPLLEQANPNVAENPAKAPWYFLGLQEMLHYFPPVVAGVLVPGLVVMALIVIPYFRVNIEADGLFLKDRQRRLRIFYVVASGLSLFLLLFKVYAALLPTLIMAGIMLLASQSSAQSPSAFRRYLAARPLSYWVMTWFLFELVVLTAIGTFFRGPGWAFVWPWQGS
jgi:quinol-cytochrome oxidoreductase complex cytochrome b subunit